MSDIVVKITVEVLSVLALATKQVKQGRSSKPSVGYISLMAECDAEKFAKKLLGEIEIDAVLQRLDRLTHDEARIIIAQALQVVHGLVNNMKVVMDGMQVLYVRPAINVWLDRYSNRRQGINVTYDKLWVCSSL